MRRWCGRSNKEPTSADVLHQGIDESALRVVERRRVELAPVALVEAEASSGVTVFTPCSCQARRLSCG